MPISYQLLSETEIKRFLNNPNLPVCVLTTIDSTNEEAKRHKTTPLLVVSEEQTKGKGRRSKSFYSPKHTGIYMSLAINHPTFLSQTLPVTITAGVAVSEAITQITGIRPQIKWINDIMLSGKKIGGILTESVLGTAEISARIIIGIGINLTTEGFPEALAEIAASLSTTENPIDKNRLIAEIVNLLEVFSKQSESKILQKYKEYSGILNKTITVIEGQTEYSATALDILSDGRLLIETEKNEQKVLSSGEVSIRIQ